MKKIIASFPILFLLLISANTNAQDCEGCLYMSAQFDSVIVETVHFGEGENIDGNMEQLYADVYHPYGDTATNRPVVIFAFGGGFVAGARDDWYVVEICRQFAKAGYVAVANDYRIGVDPLEVILQQQMRIVFRPMQDMRAIVQYLKADFSELGNNFNIDTNKIIMGGASAGAITALMTAYCDKESEMSEMGNINILDDLGGFFSSTGFYPQYNWDVAATINVAGALVKADWIESGDVPVISTHGDEDDIVPYTNGTLAGILQLEGSFLVHQAALAQGVCSYLYTMEGEGHPSEETEVEYIRSVFYRLQQRVLAVVEERNFCCELDVEITPNDTLFITPNSSDILLAANVMGDNGNATYQWCGLPCTFSSADPSVQIQPDTSWRYVSLIVTEGECQESDLQVIKPGPPFTSVSEIENDSKLSVFPQPASDRVQIHLPESALIKNGELKIFSINGKLVHRSNLQILSSNNIQLDVSKWNSGLYLIQISSESEMIFTEKLMVR